MSEYRSDEDGTNRRQLLRNIAVSAAAVTGFGTISGTAGAEPSRVPVGYADPIQTETLLESHASDLLSALATEGLLERGSVAELPTRRPKTSEEIAAGTEGTVWGKATTDGDSDLVLSVTSVEDGMLQVGVKPDTGESYALHTEDGAVTAYELDETGSLVSTSGCSCKYEIYCVVMYKVYCENTSYCGTCL